MKRAKTISILATFAGLVLVGALAAEPSGPRGRRGGPGDKGPRGPRFGGGEAIAKMLEHRLSMLPDALELTAEQRKTYDEIAKKHQEAVARLMSELRKQAETFRTEMNEILTAEQRDKLEQMRMRVRERFGGGRSRGGAGRRMAPGLIKKALEQLELAAEKKEQVDAVLRETREKMDEMRKKMDEVRKTIEANEQKDREARRTMFRAMVEKIREALGPEDFARLEEKIRDMASDLRGRGGPRWHQRGDRPGGPAEHRPRGGRGERPGRPSPGGGEKSAKVEPDWLW